jgi:hypothetical protein
MGAGNSGPKHLDPINVNSITPPKININNLIYNKEMFKGGKIRINKKSNNVYNTIANIIILLYFILLFIFYISKNKKSI